MCVQETTKTIKTFIFHSASNISVQILWANLASSLYGTHNKMSTFHRLLSFATNNGGVRYGYACDGNDSHRWCVLVQQVGLLVTLASPPQTTRVPYTDRRGGPYTSRTSLQLCRIWRMSSTSALSTAAEGIIHLHHYILHLPSSDFLYFNHRRM